MQSSAIAGTESNSSATARGIGVPYSIFRGPAPARQRAGDARESPVQPEIRYGCVRQCSGTRFGADGLARETAALGDAGSLAGALAPLEKQDEPASTPILLGQHAGTCRLAQRRKRG